MPEHDAPQSRNEAILQNILGEHNELLEPQSRNEAILQAILYGDSYTEDAQSRIETLLLCILNGTTTDLQPLSRNEEILIAKINGGTYDKEPQSRIEELLIEWLNAFVDKTVTGAVCSFDDAIAGQPLIDLTAQIVATQSGSGDPSPSNVRPISGFTGVNVTRCGKNLFDENTTFVNKGLYFVADDILPNTVCNMSLIDRDTSVDMSGVYFGFISHDYTSGTLPSSKFRWVITNGIVQANKINKSATDKMLTGLACYPQNQATLDKILARYHIQIEIGSTATEYEPYSGNTYSVTWQTEAGTVYVGYIDLTTGVLTVTHGKIKFSDIPAGDLRYSNNNGAWSNYLFFTNLSTRKRATQSKCSCYNFVTSSEANVPADSYILPSWNTYIYIRDDSITSVSDFLSNRGNEEVVFELATPQTYQLTPKEVKTLLGVNNIYSNTGNSTVKYKARG